MCLVWFFPNCCPWICQNRPESSWKALFQCFWVENDLYIALLKEWSQRIICRCFLCISNCIDTSNNLSHFETQAITQACFWGLFETSLRNSWYSISVRFALAPFFLPRSAHETWLQICTKFSTTFISHECLHISVIAF